MPSAKTTRGPLLLVARRGARARAGPKPSSAERRVPGEDVVLGDQRCRRGRRRRGRRTAGWDRASRDCGSDAKRRNGVPALRRSVRSKKPGAGRSRTTQSSWPSPARSRNCWRLADASAKRREARRLDHGSKRAVAAAGRRDVSVSGLEVALVEPGVGLLGEDAREPLAVEIDPLIRRAVDAAGQVLEARRRRPRGPSSSTVAGLYSNSSGGSDLLQIASRRRRRT